MLFLTRPDLLYKESFLDGLREFQREGLLQQYDLQRLSKDFSPYLRRAQDEQNAEKLSPPMVPSTTYWLMESQEDRGPLFVGNLSVRLELNAFFLKVAGHIGYQIRPSLRRRGYGKIILRMGLDKAHEAGLERVLLTCDEQNIASKKVIESNGGRFENAVEIEGSPMKKLRYWIDLRELD